MLAAKCNLLGWNLSRETLAKIESQIRWVADCELLCFAEALQIPVNSLLSDGEPSAQLMRKFFRAR